MQRKTFNPPDWVKEAIFYQIFPDRFAKSDKYKVSGKFFPWGTKPTEHNLCGGNLQGVTEHLDYLKELGINAIYFCPVFKSNSNHRYHTFDYFQIDPVLGQESDFLLLLEEAHKKNIRIVLDGVFNHCSRGFFEFNSLLELGEESPYKDWFLVDSFPLKAYSGKPNYKCWWNMPALPKFNTNNKEVREFLFRVARYWLEKGIDGWRLDVPNEIDDDSFWREFRLQVKKINPDAYIVGEIWDNPSRWLQGDMFDGVMNYPLRRLLLDFLLKEEHSAKSIQEFCTKTERVFSEQAFGIPLNLLSSHDTTRLISQPGGSIKKSALLSAVLFFMPGAISTYYGEEIAMEGLKDPDNRRCYPWGAKLSKEKQLYNAFYKKLIDLRKSERALTCGKLKINPQNNGFEIQRTLKNETLSLQVHFKTHSESEHFQIFKNGNLLSC